MVDGDKIIDDRTRLIGWGGVSDATHRRLWWLYSGVFVMT